MASSKARDAAKSFVTTVSVTVLAIIGACTETKESTFPATGGAGPVPPRLPIPTANSVDVLNPVCPEITLRPVSSFPRVPYASLSLCGAPARPTFRASRSRCTASRLSNEPAAAKRTASPTVVAPIHRVHCFQLQKLARMNMFALPIFSPELSLPVNSSTVSSTIPGAIGTLHRESDADVPWNCSAKPAHSEQRFTCSEIASASVIESSPSRNAMTSSGATGCALVFIRVPRIPSTQPLAASRQVPPADRAVPSARETTVTAPCSAAVQAPPLSPHSSIPRIPVAAALPDRWHLASPRPAESVIPPPPHLSLQARDTPEPFLEMPAGTRPSSDALAKS